MWRLTVDRITHNDTQSAELLSTKDRPVCRDLYLTKRNIDKKQTSMLPAGFLCNY